MKGDENKPDKKVFAIIGFVLGVLTVVLVYFAIK
jgi:asparagine N-glycosylation enzyme membrane subunit Stt3